MQIVLFGANGYLGDYLYRQLKANGFKILGTSRRKQVTDDLLYFDILRSDINHIVELLDDEHKVAIICIAETNIDKCYENYSHAYEINVVRTKILIEKLIKENFQIIFFSSDNVFDGVTGNYTEDSETNAINKYGMMKEEVERFLMSNDPDACILRLPKVVSAIDKPQNIFTEWSKCMKKGQFRCIRDNYLSFLSIKDLYYAIVLVARQRLCGLYQLAGDVVYKRIDIVKKFCDTFHMCAGGGYFNTGI